MEKDHSRTDGGHSNRTHYLGTNPAGCLRESQHDTVSTFYRQSEREQVGKLNRLQRGKFDLQRTLIVSIRIEQ